MMVAMAKPSHFVFPRPDNLDVPVWRYMDFTKFVSTLVNKGLFMCRADKLSDPFEGALSKPMIKYDDPKFLAMFANLDDVPGRLSRIYKDQQATRHSAFISSWHMSEFESAAMWKLYARTEEAICIRSTFAKLDSLLPSDVYAGKITYVPYESAEFPIDVFSPFIYKRMSFEHEREIRALYVDPSLRYGESNDPLRPLGKWVSLDLSQLIGGVYVAPTTPEWFFDTVRATIKQFGFDFQVHRSKLDESPLW
jgi:hypothetical protein